MSALEADGAWCPMAHCNQTNDSTSDLPPILSVGRRHAVGDFRVSPCAWDNLGAYSGTEMAVCAYESPLHPALVAYDYQEGAILWTSPLEDLPGLDRRRPHGVLLARRGGDGAPQRCVFAANPAELVAYTSGGERLWKRQLHQVLGPAQPWIGAPTSIRLTPAGDLVALTTGGWLVKLDPRDGRTVDAHRMDADVEVDGSRYRGTFIPIKSPVVVGSTLYCVAGFWPPPPSLPLPPLVAPIFVLRLPLDRPHEVRSIAVGTCRGAASPAGLAAADGTVLVFAAVSQLANGRLRPGLVAVEDEQGILSIRWRSSLDTPPGDDVYSAPGLHAGSRMLLVATGSMIFAYRNVDTLAGDVPPPMPIPAGALPALGGDPSGVRANSPFALTFNPEGGEVVAYTNFRVFPPLSAVSYGFLGAFALPAEVPGPPRTLWSRPLAVTAAGEPSPGPGTAGQPALFRYRAGPDEATGLIVNTVLTGTYLFW